MSKLETNIIAPSTGTTITLGESGDTVALGSGATQTGFGGVNTPAFLAYVSTSSSLSSGSYTKVQFNSELFDSDSCYDNATNYRFTPTSSGKYFLSTICRVDSIDSGAPIEISIYKNGNGQLNFRHTPYNTTSSPVSIGENLIVTANGTTDYFEVYIYQNSGTRNVIQGSTYSSWFGGYKIIE